MATLHRSTRACTGCHKRQHVNPVQLLVQRKHNGSYYWEHYLAYLCASCQASVTIPFVLKSA